MANRIDETYFTGARALPLKTDDDLDLLDEFIEEKENKFFIDVFGYEFQKNMLANPTDTRFKLILDGGEFTDTDTNLQYWEGINESLANYIYFYYNKELILTRNTTGFSAGKLENGIKVNPISKPVAIYNRISEAMDILNDLFIANESDYEDDNLIFKPLKTLNEFDI